LPAAGADSEGNAPEQGSWSRILRRTASSTKGTGHRVRIVDPAKIGSGQCLQFQEERMTQCALHLQILMVMSSFLLFTHSSRQIGKEAFVSQDKPLQSEEQITRRAIDGFNQLFNKHDVDGLAALLTEDTVFEDTSPAPDGQQIEGKAAVVEFWRGWFVRNPDARFETEEIIVCGNRAVVRWVYRKIRNGQPWHLRGADIFTVRDGKIAAKLAYVKS
jgi:ketosteroid isomerase-like protein